MPNRGAFTSRLLQSHADTRLQQTALADNNARASSENSIAQCSPGVPGTGTQISKDCGGLGGNDAAIGPKLHTLVTTPGGQALVFGEHSEQLVDGLLRLLRALQVAYSEKCFQAEVAELHRVSEGSEQKFLLSLGPAAARVQAPVFARFGMPQGQRGVLIMKASVRALRQRSEELATLAADLRELLLLPREELDMTQQLRGMESQLTTMSGQIAKAPLDVRGPLAQAFELPYNASPVDIAKEVMKIGDKARQLADRQFARGRSEIVGVGKVLGPGMADCSDDELRETLVTSFHRYLEKMYQRVVTPLSSFTSEPSQWQCSWAKQIVDIRHVVQLWGTVDNEVRNRSLPQGVTVIDDAVELPLIEQACAELQRFESAGDMSVSKDPCNPGARSKWLSFETDEDRAAVPASLRALSLRLAGLPAALLETAKQASVAAPSLRVHPHVMAATYRQGVEYHCHKDSYDGTDNQRMLTILLYLNSQWCPGDGGELRIFEKSRNAAQQHGATPAGVGADTCDEHRYIDVEPLAGRLVLFRSREIWHAVREPRDQRSALTLWVMA